MPAGVGEGHGLTGMRERVTMLGGSVRVETTARGVAVIARIPVPADGAGESG